MSVSYFVRYQGQAGNAEEFLRYYREHHAPILARFPGMRRTVLHTPLKACDPFPGRPDRFLLLAQMVFDSLEAMESALQSEARGEARTDFANFLKFEGDVFHQSTQDNEVFAHRGELKHEEPS